jgi:hypothetical protein
MATILINGMSVSFSAQDSYDLDGYITSYTWSIYGSEYQGIIYNHTFSTIGYKTATLTVTDNDELTGEMLVGFYIGQPSNPDTDKTKVGGHVEVEGDKVSIINSEEGFDISIIESKENYLKFKVDSKSENGRLVVMDVKTQFDLDQLEEIQVELNGDEVEKTDLDTILQASGNTPQYYIITHDDYYQLLVYIPDISSSQVVEVKLKEDSDSETSILDSIWVIITIFVIALIFIIIAVFFKIKKKEEIEYYRDFRVAEHRAQNGVHTNTTNTETAREDSDNWDDLI